MANERARLGWGFWLQWLLATTAGWTAGLAVLVLMPLTTGKPLLEGTILAAAATLTGLYWEL